MREVLIGIDQDNCIIQASVDNNGIIRGFDGYYKVELADGDIVLEWCQWFHTAIINGIEYNSDQHIDEVLIDKASIEPFKDLYTVETVRCNECGNVYCIDDYEAYIVTQNRDVLCISCAKAVDVVQEIVEPEDLFEAPNIVDLDQTGLTEVDCLFCDSSGFGSDSEPALTRSGALREVTRILDDNADSKLYAGLTGVGQFQVYVSIFKKG